MIRTIIIDDEPASVNVLSLLLKKSCKEDVQIVATTNSAHLGGALIEKHQPDLVFVDIEMPGMSGIDLLQTFVQPNFQFVFVTAFDAYAVEAFRLSAIDYLLKPVEADDIVRVVEKIKKNIHKNDNSINNQLQNLQKILLQNNSTSESKIGIRMADKIVFLNTSEIIYCEAHGAYTNVHLLNSKKVVSSKSLGDFESQLNSQLFFRIHHSTI